MKSPVQNTLNRVFVLALIAMFALPSVLLAESAKPSNKWRIEVSEGANSDGSIVFQFQPEGGEAFEATVQIKDGRRENGVAVDIRDQLREQLDGDIYHVERDDGEDVLVKRHHGAADFGLVVVSNSVKSVRLNLDRE